MTVNDEALAIAQAVRREGGRALIVGGWVRDRLLGHDESKDIDIEVFGVDAARPGHHVGETMFGQFMTQARRGDHHPLCGRVEAPHQREGPAARDAEPRVDIIGKTRVV